MAYDRESFLAGVAVGRNMRSWPIRENAYAGYFQFTINLTSGGSGTGLNYRFWAAFWAGSDPGTIEWGDGSENTSDEFSNIITHDYAAYGVYVIRIKGELAAIRFGSGTASGTGVLRKNAQALISIDTALPPVPSHVVGPIYRSLDDMLYNCSHLETLPFKFLSAYTDKRVKISSMVRLCSGCSALSAFPDRLFEGLHFGRETTATTPSMSQAFMGCSGVKEVSAEFLNNPEFSYFTNISYLFYQSGIEEVPDGFLDAFVGVERVPYAFAECLSLRTLPGGLLADKTSLQIAWYFCFGCNKLESIPDVFSGCTNLTRADSAFEGCTHATSVSPFVFDGCDSVTNFDGTFFDCTGISSNVPELWVSNPNASSDQCFYRCTGAANYSQIPAEWR